MFKIITTCWNNADYVGRCIHSVLNQSTLWQMCIVTNMPIVETEKTKDKRILYKYNENSEKIQNIINAIETLNPDDNDILCFVDGDDYLMPNALDIVNKYYYADNLLITYGNFIDSHGIASPLKGYTEDDFKDGIRKQLTYNWQASHLKTMKYKLWKQIDHDESFKHKGKWINACDDMAFMIPALEMAGYKRSQFVKEFIYSYNIDNPECGFKINSANEDNACLIVASKKPYKELK